MKGKILIVEDEFVVAKDLCLILEKAGYEIAGIASTVTKALDIIQLKKPAWVFLDIQLTGKLNGIDLARKLNEMDIPFIYVSANSSQSVLENANETKPYGFLVKPFREKDVLVALDIAIYRHENNMETQLVKEVELQNEILNILNGNADWKQKLREMVPKAAEHIPFDYFSICWTNAKHHNESLAFFRETKSLSEMSNQDLSKRTGKSFTQLLSAKGQGTLPEKPVFFNGMPFEEMLAANPFRKIVSREFELSSVLFIPVNFQDKEKVLFSFYSHAENVYSEEHLAVLSRLQLLLNKIADQFTNDRPIHPSTPAPAPNHKENNIDLAQTQNTADNIGLVGSGVKFEHIKNQIALIAPHDISVLILGESGTGKEKIAQYIHALSNRKSSPLVKVNCAAIPATLMESELFGHEKGAFTGALNRRIGRFEQASKGTIFLDEIGELPLDLQVKLLRALQEREIVRVGSNQTITVDVRIIAATNRNLEKEVAEGRFRLDLYYRLNVYPLILPPLRERREDIPDLAEHFAIKLGKKIGKNMSGLTADVKEALKNYDWPGNIRELENLIERSILLAKGLVLDYVNLPTGNVRETAGIVTDTETKTFKEMERDHIFHVLNKCGGKVAGPGGAAEILDLAPTTLITKMKKLGIVKKFKN